MISLNLLVSHNTNVKLAWNSQAVLTLKEQIVAVSVLSHIHDTIFKALYFEDNIRDPAQLNRSRRELIRRFFKRMAFLKSKYLYLITNGDLKLLLHVLFEEP